MALKTSVLRNTNVTLQTTVTLKTYLTFQSSNAVTLKTNLTLQTSATLQIRGFKSVWRHSPDQWLRDICCWSNRNWGFGSRRSNFEEERTQFYRQDFPKAKKNQKFVTSFVKRCSVYLSPDLPRFSGSCKNWNSCDVIYFCEKVTCH